MKKRGFLVRLCIGVLLAGLLFPTQRVTADPVISANSVEAEGDKLTISMNGVDAEYYFYSKGGQTSNNASANEYKWDMYATPVNSYLQADADGGFTRLEYCNKKVYIEKFSSAFSLQSTKTITMELPIFGGAFWGSNYNFIVFGQMNPNDSDETEVVRVVKYDKSWNRISAKSIYGANTYIPFDAGSLRMTEASGILYIHTCHEMYAHSDGVHHQANMTFVLNQGTLDIQQQWYGVMNIGYGYVSHSFNQFVVTDGTYLYRMDHGDAYPRSICITKSSVNSITSCSKVDLLSIIGSVGANDTGVEMGGFELMGSRLVSAGNSVEQVEDGWSASGQRNIFVGSVNTDLNDKKIVWLTNYEDDAAVSIGNPHLVKVSDTIAYVLWEESANSEKVVKIAKIDAGGTLTGGVYTVRAGLSDCKPVYAAGKLVWYMTSNSSPVFYSLDTAKLSTYNEKVKLSDCAVSMSKTSYPFEGSYLEPGVTMTYDGYTLKKGVDYTISYSNNYYPGTATVTIKGTGIFTGEVIKTFTITAVDISSGYRLVLTPSEAVYDGSYHTADWSIYNGDEEVYVAGSMNYSYSSRVGTYQYTFKANESYGYKGTLTAIFTIRPKSVKDAVIDLEKTSYTYDGKTKKPSAVVSLDGVWLTEGKDYTISYSNNKKVGTATVKITGKGNYGGTAKTKFKIKTLPKGTVKKDSTGKAKYKITKAGMTGGTVEYVAPVKKTATVTIPSAVKISGVTYKVTSIAKNAFKGNKKLTKITIGKNVKKIGISSFNGCKKLKTITIKTTKLTTKNVGSNAFKGIYSKAKIYVPKKKYSAYKSIIKKRGAGSKVKYKKF